VRCEPDSRQGATSGAFPPVGSLAFGKTDASLEAIFAPMGCSVHACADEPALLNALDAAFAGWEAPPVEAEPKLRIELKVSAALWGSEEPDIAADAQSLHIRGCGVEALADARGFARASVSLQFATDTAALRAHVIEPLILFLLTSAGRAPIHAAGVVMDGRALLLAGPSGSGKSCLALAAHALGFDVLSDDTVYVQTRPELRAWGLPRPVHVYAEDAGSRLGAIRSRNGKFKRALPLSAGAQCWAPPGALILLETGVEVALRPIPASEAEAALVRPEPGFALRRAAITDAVSRMAAIGAWRLTLSANPAEAIALLAHRMPEIRAGMASC